MKTDAELSLDKLFGTLEPLAFQQAAFESYQAKGLPSRRVEEYKYSDLRLAFDEIYPLATNDYSEKTAKACLKKLNVQGIKIVMVNGELDAELSSEIPAGLSFFPLIQPYELKGLGENDPVIKLNEAFTPTNFVLNVPDNFKSDAPITLVHLSTDEKTSVFSRVYVEVGENSSLSLYEIDGFANNSQNNCVLKVALNQNSQFTHYRHQAENAATSLWSGHFTLDTNAKLSSFTLNEGVTFTRNQYFVEMMGHDCTLDLNGIQILNGETHGDTTLQVRHHGLRGISRELFKNVLKSGGKGVFQGKIIVQKDAQKTDGKMSSNAILLDDDCQMMNKPELEIYADDVVCGHGATCGQIDDDLLFYMMARGISKQDAFALLLQAFCGDALEKIEDENLKAFFETRVVDKLKSF